MKFKTLLAVSVAFFLALSASADDAYIQSNGDRGVDTGYHVTPNTKIELDFEFTEVTANARLMGIEPESDNVADENNPRFDVFLNGSKQLSLRVTGSDHKKLSGSLSLVPDVSTRYTLVVDLQTTTDHLQILDSSGSLIEASGAAFAGITQPSEPAIIPLGLFGMRWSSVSGAGNFPNPNPATGEYTWDSLKRYSKMKVYSLKIYEKVNSSYSLKRWYQPCCYDGVYGFRDVVNGGFYETVAYPNVDNPGDIGYGGDVRTVTTPTPDADPYVESDGTQGVDLGYYVGPNTKVELDFELVEATGHPALFGITRPNESPNNGNKVWCVLYLGEAETGKKTLNFFGAYDNGEINQTLFNINVGERRKFEVDFSKASGSSFALDGAANENNLHVTNENNTATIPLGLFCMRTPYGFSASKAKMKVYGIKIYEKNGGAYDLVRDYKPVQVGGGMGLRDAVGGEVFVPGNDSADPLSGGGGEVLDFGTGYIESSGNLAFNTGYKVDGNTKIQLDFQLSAGQNNGSCVVFGVLDPNEDSSGLNKVYCLAYIGGDGETLRLRGAFEDGATDKILRTIGTDRHTFIVDFPATADMIRLYNGDGTTNWTSKALFATNGSNVAAYPVGLFNRCDTAVAVSAADFPNPNRAKMKVYGMKFYEKVGGSYVLKKNFVPCLKGGVPGFKDMVSGLFSTGIKIDDVGYGGDILIEKDDPYISTATNIVTRAAVKGECVYLDTGYTVTPNSRIELDFAPLMPNADAGTYNHTPDFMYAKGPKRDSTDNELEIYGRTSTGYIGYKLGYSDYHDLAVPLNAACNIRRTISAGGHSIAMITSGYTNKLDTISATWGIETDLTSMALRLAASNANNDFAPMKIYGLKIYESDALVKDFRPFVTNGVPGLIDVLDKTNQKFSTTYGGDSRTNLVFDAGGDFTVTNNDFLACTDNSSEAYLEFTGTGGRIWTGCQVTKDSCIELDFSLWNTRNLLGTGGQQDILAQESDDGTFARLYVDSDQKFAYAFQNRSAKAEPSYTHLNTVPATNTRKQFKLDGKNGRVTVKCGDDTLYDEDMEGTRNLEGGSLSLRIGNWYECMRLYSFKVTTNGEVVRDFIPYVTNGVAGLYDLCGKQFYRISHNGEYFDGKVSGMTRGGETFQAGPSITYGRTDGKIVATISCKAAGAHSYEWYRQGELVENETNDTLIVDWGETPSFGNVAYSVRPVYSVFKETIVGEEATVTVRHLTSGLISIFK